MYYPYFRGKQFDLLALSALTASGILSSKIVPIIEPVKNSKALLTFITTAQQKNLPFYLIQNPQAGDFLTADGAKQLQQLTVPKGWILQQSLETLPTAPQLLIASAAAPVLESDWQQNQRPVLVAEEFRLLRKIQGPKILSQDVFTRLPHNSFYQECLDELFSSAHLTFKQRGFSGFSDFSIDSRIYYEQSYPSKTLSLHLVYFAHDHLRIRHFLSSEEAPSQKEKFLELMAAVHQERHLWGKKMTQGLQLLTAAAQQGRFPGMGVMRKAAVMHHLELMSRYLDNNL